MGIQLVVTTYLKMVMIEENMAGVVLPISDKDVQTFGTIVQSIKAIIRITNVTIHRSIR